MQPNKNMNEDLLVKNLLGEADAAEQQELEQWIKSSKENRKQYEHFRLIWDASKELEARSTIDVEDAWERFKERRDEPKKPVNRVISLPHGRSWMRVAAAVVVLLGSALIVYNISSNTGGKMMAVNSGDAVLTDTLPDGSVVTLNKNSSLSYNSKFNGKTRDVKLEGEAFFSVAADKEHPFVIDVNGNTVTVVGTSFNVKTTEDRTEVIVETGIVEVAKNEKAVRLHPNEKATILLNRDAPVKELSTDELYNYYKTNEFVCSGTSLQRLVEVLNEAYNADIVIGNSRLDKLSLNTTFSDVSLEYILEVISKTYNIQIIKNGDTIILQ